METEIAVYKPQTAVSVRRTMAANPEIMAVLGPAERSVFLATTAKTIMEYEDGELAIELAKAVKFIAKDVGYRATDNAEMSYLCVRIVEILKRHYGGLTLRDFRLAFEMCITGALDEFLPKRSDGTADRGHYQSFNAEYICKVLNAYEKQRANVLKKAYDATPTPVDESKVRGAMNELRQNLIDAYGYFKVNRKMPEISAIKEMLFYDILADTGMATDIVVTDEILQSELQKKIRELTVNYQMYDVRHLKEKGTDDKEIQARAFETARRGALCKTFEKMVADGVVLSEHIKFE